MSVRLSDSSLLNDLLATVKNERNEGEAGDQPSSIRCGKVSHSSSEREQEQE